MFVVARPFDVRPVRYRRVRYPNEHRGAAMSNTTPLYSGTCNFDPTRSHRNASARAGRRPDGIAMLEIVLLIAIVLALIASVVLTSGRLHGQTLWSIAASHPVYGQTTEQTAEMISEINGIHAGRLIAGDTVAVPTRPSDAALTASR